MCISSSMTGEKRACTIMLEDQTANRAVEKHRKTATKINAGEGSTRKSDTSYSFSMGFDKSERLDGRFGSGFWCLLFAAAMLSGWMGERRSCVCTKRASALSRREGMGGVRHSATPESHKRLVISQLLFISRQRRVWKEMLISVRCRTCNDFSARKHRTARHVYSDHHLVTKSHDRKKARRVCGRKLVASGSGTLHCGHAIVQSMILSNSRYPGNAALLLFGARFTCFPMVKDTQHTINDAYFGEPR